tara:strand:+ start:373 stop:1887 length:1515 start_codon:yes stop_codon:yes gene_type:complete
MNLDRKIDNITIIGGGTAGLVSALILKRKFADKNITIIESSNIGIVGVGESSTEHWHRFCNYVGISPLSAILECDATFKIGVYFEDWADENFLHGIADPFDRKEDDYYKVYGHLIANNCSTFDLHSKKQLQNLISTSFFYDINDSPTKQYHFDTFKLNKFLHKECHNRGIKIIIDDIDDVKLDNKTEEILYVSSKKKKYDSEFFIDCSGFAKLILKNTYGINWISYSEYFPINSAISFGTDEMSEYNMYTKATARSAGWNWTIPTQTRTGNGYVYCDRFIDEENAINEMEIAYGKKLKILKTFKFDPGRLEKSWHKNCFAVGLSQSFIEPLEATSIGSVIQQMFCFVNFLPSYDIDTCNEHINDIFDNISDYIQSHYLTKREDTPFWKEIKYNLKLTKNLKKYLKIWENRLPMETDIICPWGLFSAVNYIPILHGLKWINIEKIKNEYENSGVDNSLNTMLNNVDSESFWISHKKMIKILMEGDYKKFNKKFNKKSNSNSFNYN